MQNFKLSPYEMISSFWRNRNLIRSLVKREVVGRYRGSVMGIMWSFLNPVFMLAVYTFVFSVIFKSRWNVSSDSRTEFALVLFAGLIIFNIFSECINRASGLILSNTNYVKKVVFPLEVFPWVAIGSALFHASISLGVWLIAYIIFIGVPNVTIFLLPIVLLPFILFILGLVLTLASLGVYLRDVSQFITIIVSVLMFLSPIFYPVTAIPEEFRYLIYLNPLTIVIEQARDVLYWGNDLNLQISCIYLFISALFAWLGFVWFQKTRKGFADVI